MRLPDAASTACVHDLIMFLVMIEALLVRYALLVRAVSVSGSSK